MNPKNDFIEELINRYFEGLSSAEEEDTLYAFFMRENVPDDLLKYKPVFHYFATGIVDEFKVADTMQKRKNVRRKKQHVAWWMAAAASILLVLSITVWKTLQTPDFDPYEGSCIIRNGVRITDLNVIRGELDKTVELAMAQRKEYQQLIQQANEDNAYVKVMKKVEEQKNEIANKFVDENAKKKVRKILNMRI
ncbi:MAG: hypothetical protein FWF52_09365 [Candidatus Azobacteroides sp.]|nr:hypothetical protein [Candidatus Azobacteroides sp.]